MWFLCSVAFHWLLICFIGFRIDFKILLFIYLSLNGSSPPYISYMYTSQQGHLGLLTALIYIVIPFSYFYNFLAFQFKYV